MRSATFATGEPRTRAAMDFWARAPWKAILKSKGLPTRDSIAGSGMPNRLRRNEKPPEFESVAEMSVTPILRSAPRFQMVSCRIGATSIGVV